MDKEKKAIETFDYMYTTNQIQLLKSALPYFPAKMQSFLIIYIKFQELLYTISLFKHTHQSFLEPEKDLLHHFPDFLKEVSGFLSKEEISKCEQLNSMLQNFEQIKQMQNMMQLYDTLSPDSTSSFSSFFPDQTFDFNELLKSAAKPESEGAPSDAVKEALQKIFPNSE